MHRVIPSRAAVVLVAALLVPLQGQTPKSLSEARDQVESAGSVGETAAAIDRMTSLKTSPTRQFLLGLLRGETRRPVREAIYRQLGNHSHPSVVQALRAEFGKRSDVSELRAIAQSLGRLGTKGEAALLALLRDRDTHRQSAVVRALRRVDDPAVNAALVKAFDRGSPAVKIDILDVLASRQDVRPLVQLCQKASRDKASRVRAKAFASLSSCKDPRTFEFLKKALADKANRAHTKEIAVGLAGQGMPGLRLLVDSLTSPDKVLRDAAVAGLAAAGRSDETLRALIDAFDAAPDDGQERILQAMAGYAETNGLTRVRVRALDARRSGTRTEALVQLAEQGHEVTREAVLEQAADAALMKRANDRARVIYAMGTVLDEDLLPRFLELCAEPSYPVRIQMRKLLAREDGAVLRVLGRLGLESEDPKQRQIVVNLLVEGTDAQTTEYLVRALRDASPEVVATATRALVKRGDKRVVPRLEKALDGEVEELRLQAMLSLHKIQKGSPRWPKRVFDLLRKASAGDGSGPMRFLALDLLTDLGYRPALSEALAMLDSPSWQVRSAAYSFCRKVRDLRSIPRIIAVLPRENGRLQAEALDTLQSLTGRDYRQADQWRRWWTAEGKGFELPPAPPASASPRTAPSVMTYYSIPMTSNAVCFLVDISGSMGAKVGTAKITRLQAAKDALKHVVTNCRPEFRFNLIPFSDEGRAWRRELTSASEEHKAAALKFILRFRPAGGTNIYDALEIAFQDPAVDTIYLLSDGEPSSGAITNQEDLADQVQLWNSRRKIRIHTISIGRDSGMMERMSRDSGGTYVRRL